jgi:hypothetical protein
LREAALRTDPKERSKRAFACLLLCRFSAAGMTVSPRTPRAGGRKVPRQEIAGWERRWCRNYGDFAAGSGVDVAERGGNVGNFATRHGRELSFERVTDRLCKAIFALLSFAERQH